jgi:hypothetical protein
MAFIGTPLDTRNTFQSLQGKRFNGDGSTTAFTLDVAPSSTLDLEVFVGNVRQDPNSAYTVSGTTLTFTGAPPSGTNNIYVVHQAKSVGTITPGANSVGVTELNLSDGSSGQFIKTDGSGTLSFASVASLAGIDDQSSSNDDQLTITDTAVVINEDSDDVDFRVESNGNANMLFISGGNDVVGVGAEGDLGVGLHIKSADSGASVDGNADELVIEGSGDSGMSILSGTSDTGSIIFGDSGDNNVGKIEYDHGNNRMVFTADADEFLRIASNGEVSVNDGQLETNATVFKVKGSATYATAIFIHGATSGEEAIFHFRDGANEQCGSVTINAANNTTAYNTSSDYRLKENESSISDGITRLKQLKPYRFNWKSNSSGDKVDGFFAHEVSNVIPEAVYGEKDGEEMQGIDQSKLVPLLTAALQEAVTKIEALEARVTTLEG